MRSRGRFLRNLQKCPESWRRPRAAGERICERTRDSFHFCWTSIAWSWQTVVHQLNLKFVKYNVTERHSSVSFATNPFHVEKGLSCPPFSPNSSRLRDRLVDFGLEAFVSTFLTSTRHCLPFILDNPRCNSGADLTRTEIDKEITLLEA